MTTTTSYGTWANATGRATVEVTVAEALGGFAEDYNVAAIVVDYRAAINAALPEGVSLAGDQFYGPYPMEDGADDEIRDAIDEGVDLFAIVAAHHR